MESLKYKRVWHCDIGIGLYGCTISTLAMVAIAALNQAIDNTLICPLHRAGK
jgi:hypothetical protein